MGAGGKGGSPPTPNFNAAATPNQTNAFGVSSGWSNTPDSTPMPDWVKNPGVFQQDAANQWKAQHPGQWSQNQSFTGPLGGAVQGMEGQLANAWGSPLDNGQQARTAAQDAIYGQETSRLDPQWQQREHDFQTQLANQGIDPNSQAYATAQGNFDRGRNDAYQQANYGSVIGGGQEAQRQQQMDLTARMAPLGALGGLSGLTGQSQNPLLAAAMAQYQGALQKYGIDQQGKNSAMGGLANLGGDAAMIAKFSDERLKEDVIRHHDLEVLPGVPVATFRYKWEPPGTEHLGVIAQDVEKVRPDLVTYDPDGYRMVPGYLWLR